jgi:hypothetical protein
MIFVDCILYLNFQYFFILVSNFSFRINVILVFDIIDYASLTLNRPLCFLEQKVEILFPQTHVASIYCTLMMLQVKPTFLIIISKLQFLRSRHHQISNLINLCRFAYSLHRFCKDYIVGNFGTIFSFISYRTFISNQTSRFRIKE